MDRHQFNPRTQLDARTLLRDIPIEITVEGVRVTGEIVMASQNDMLVQITSPTAAYGTSLHVPHFAMPSRALATTADLTAHGRKSAEWLLRELYNHSMGKGSGWGLCTVSPDGVWTELEMNGKRS